MKLRAALFALLVLLGTAAIPPRTVAAGSSAPLDLGYGPSTLFPVSAGSPVYTGGEQLWARSHFNGTVQVTVGQILFTGPNPTIYGRFLDPGLPTRLLTFNSSTPQGLWYVRVANAQYPQILFVVSDAASRPANLSLSAYHLAGSSVIMNFTTSPGVQMYDARACVLGSSPASVARVNVPSGVGAGYVNISKSRDSINVESVGPANVNYSLSVELYRSFSFLVPNSTTTVVTREVRVATTGAELLSGGRGATLALLPDLAIKPGAYQVRALFQGSGGVYLSSADVLIEGSSGWVWLGACRTYPVYSSNFSLPVSLDSGPSAWPASVWLMYRVFGDEGSAYLPLGLKFAAVDFLGTPWGAKLSGYRITLNHTSGVQQYSVSNGTVYAVVDSPSAQLSYRAGLGSQVFFSGVAGPVAPFTETAVSLEVGKLAVQYLVGGAGYEGGSVHVSNSAGPLASATTGGTGQVFFYLPTGKYNLTAIGGNGSASATTTLTAGQAVSVVLSAGGPSEQGPIVVGLAAAAAVGVAANVALWARGRNPGRGQPLSPSQK